MTELPRALHRAPRLIYAAAIAVFIFSVALGWSELSATHPYGEPENPVQRLLLMRILYQAGLDSIYLAATGVLAHLLLAIYLRLPRGGATAEAAE
jgi:hypothetical protein